MWHVMGMAELGVHALDALGRGLLLYLVAAGFTLILRASRFLNLAQGGFALAGVAASMAAFHITGSAAAAIPIACAAVVPVAMAAEILVVRPLRGKTLAPQVVGAFGMFLILADVNVLLAGSESALLPAPDWLSFNLSFPGSFSYPAKRLAVIAVALAAALALLYFSRFTGPGARVRAIADDPEMAAALGIDPRRLLAGVFTAGCALAALAGALSVQFADDGGWSSGALALVVAAVLWGGTGSLGGAFGAALLISSIDRFVRLVLPGLSSEILPEAATWVEASSAAAIILLTALVLLIWPKGIFRRARRWEGDW